MESLSAVIITGIIGGITTIISGWTSWFYARKKYNSEVDNNLIENMQKSLEFYIKLSDDNKDRLNEALRKNDIMEKELLQLRTQIFELMNNICYNLQCAVREREKQDVKVKSIKITKPVKIKKDETDSSTKV